MQVKLGKLKREKFERICIFYFLFHLCPMLLEATAQYRKLLIPDLIIKGVGLILSLILYPPIMMYSVLIAAFYIITLKTLSEKRVNN